MRREALHDRSVQVLSLVALLVAWGLLSLALGSKVLPSPTKVAPQVGDLLKSGDFLGPLLESLQRTVIGFVVGFVGGVAVGIAAGKARWFAFTSSPLLNVVLFAPTLVVIFLGIAILGTEITAIALITGIVVGPNVAIYMRDVMRDLDPDLLSMADSFRVSTIQRVRDVYLPYLVRPMLAATRIGFSMSWKVVMLAEVFGFSGGLGFQIRINYTVFNLTALLAWLTIFVLALLVIEQLIRVLEKAVVKWES